MRTPVIFLLALPGKPQPFFLLIPTVNSEIQKPYCKDFSLCIEMLQLEGLNPDSIFCSLMVQYWFCHLPTKNATFQASPRMPPNVLPSTAL